MYQQTMGQPQQANQVMKDEDWGNAVLSELKRSAAEYTTATLEAMHPAIRQLFSSLVQRTLQNQAELFQTISQNGGYSGIRMATPQDIQQDLQSHLQKVGQIRQMVSQLGQSMGQPSAPAMPNYQMAPGNPYGNTQMAGYQPQFMPSGGSASPMSTAPNPHSGNTGGAQYPATSSQQMHPSGKYMM